MDLGERNIVNGHNLKRGTLLGRGAFGFVYRATANINGNPNTEVAVKMLQPIDPGADARPSVLQVYKVGSVSLLCSKRLRITNFSLFRLLSASGNVIRCSMYQTLMSTH